MPDAALFESTEMCASCKATARFQQGCNMLHRDFLRYFLHIVLEEAQTSNFMDSGQISRRDVQPRTTPLEAWKGAQPAAETAELGKGVSFC